MRKLLLLLLLAFSVCSAHSSWKCKDSINYREILKAFSALIDERDSIKAEAKKTPANLIAQNDSIKISNDSLSRIINANIVAETASETQKLYNTSFSNMQSFFSNFLIMVGIVNGALAVFIGVLAWFNFKSVNELNELNNKISNIKKEIDIHEQKIANLGQKGDSPTMQNTNNEIIEYGVQS